MNVKSKIAIGVTALIGAVALIVIYGSFNPENKFFPKCVFFAVTGLKCPGCGSQRAIHALLNGDVVSAWRYNAMMILFIPLVIIMWLASLMKMRIPGLYNSVNSRWVIWGVFVLVVGWGIARNVFGW